MNRLRSTLPHAGAGVLATFTGMAAAHLAAALTTPAASPVLAVGSAVIDATPTTVKEWAVREFGTADKPILLGSVIVGTLALAGLAGVLAGRRFALGAGLLVVLAAVAAVAALLRPLAAIGDVVPSLVAAAVGPATLGWLGRRIGSGAPRRTAQATPPSAVEPGSRDKPTGLVRLDRERPVTPREGRPDRRTLLLGAGALSVAAVGMGLGGHRVIAARTRPGNVTLPVAVEVLEPLPTGLEREYAGISAFRTPNAEFYRVDTNLTLPVVPVNDWTLTIDGDVDRVVTLDYDQLSRMRMVERDITLTCVSNEVGGRYVGAARWLGVPLRDLLDEAGIGSTRADQLLSTAVDGFTISTPLEVALDGRDTMVAVGMNGEPLPAAHGFPARLVTPGLYGYVGATKWLTRLTLTTYAAQAAYWTRRDWATDAPIKISSRIDTPAPLSTIRSGPTVIGGVAWAQTRGVARVDVRIDGGPWQRAELGPDAGVDYWRQWYLPWEAAPGSHMLAVRATSGEGEVQTAVRATPFPDGSSGIQEIVVRVS